MQIAPPPAPPTEEVDAGGGGGGLSSDAKLAMVVGGLVVVAALIGSLTYLYWRRTRPAAYGTALDALADITLLPAGAGASGAGDPTTSLPPVGPLGPLGPMVPAPDASETTNPGDPFPASTSSQGLNGGATGNGALLFPPRPDEDGPSIDLGDKPLFPPRTGEQPPVLPEPPPPIVTLEDLQSQGSADDAPPGGHIQEGPREEEDRHDG